jgi:zinc/manganese transport system substrate-binding protein
MASALVIAIGVIGPGAGAATPRNDAVIVAVGAENEYASVIGAIGGKYVDVSAVMSNPNTDPHEFEASPGIAQLVSNAVLVVQNGLGYDSFMNSIEAASPNRRRRVIVVQRLLSLPDSTPNPHLWYSPSTMPKVAAAIAADLEQFAPGHRSYFAANLQAFDASLRPWTVAIAALRKQFAGAKVACTEPVADYLLQAAGLDIATPFSLQADIMNGVDLAPEQVSLEENLFTGHEVKVFVYNQQVVDSVTATFLSIAEHNHVPVVGVYETMPTPGYDYASWMLAETRAIGAALEHDRSTVRL